MLVVIVGFPEPCSPDFLARLFLLCARVPANGVDALEFLPNDLEFEVFFTFYWFHVVALI